jgi:CheY-like chemotaxis protein
MNNEITTYTIGVVGFERAERHDLRRVISMTESRQPSFKPFDKARGGCPDLILVDADRPGAVRAWNSFRRANAHRASFSPIFVGGNPTKLPCPDPYVLQRPIETTSLFSVLERAAAEVHGFHPPRSTPNEILSLTPYEVDTTLDTTAVLALSEAVIRIESAESTITHRTPEINALVVDDSLPVRVQMRGMLASIASRLDFATTAARALELTDTHRYSVIFLDGTLPDEDTYELCAQIKKHPLQREAVVVMLTGGYSPAERVMGLLAGFDNYLVKPIQPAMFNELAAEIVRPATAI